MRIARLAALVPVAAAAMAIAGGAGIAHASAGHCLASGICIKVTPESILSADNHIDVTGTPGNDNIQFTGVTVLNAGDGLPDIAVNGFDTHISEFGTGPTFITVNGLGGNDTISLAGLNQVPLPDPFVRGKTFLPQVYTTATLQSGRGNSTLIASNGGDNVLIGGPGHNLLLARNGRADIVKGSGNDTAQVDQIDKVTGVTKFLP